MHFIETTISDELDARGVRIYQKRPDLFAYKLYCILLHHSLEETTYIFTIPAKCCISLIYLIETTISNDGAAT